ncbi:MAG: sirohydrochlorin cobaltochelatase [Spirochaetaceae bacterium]|jgi:sirohydrochlorin cobaltochelatase|nr:sirohydrochlorin cobaltochelatase [Spirochaetaceae bacterium]
MKGKLKILTALVLSLSLIVLSSCSSVKPATGDQKPVLLVVSFGTSYNESRANTIEAIEKTLAAAYPGYEQRRAFTSQIIIDKLKKRDGLKIDNVTDAMKRLRSDGVKQVVVQPTHVMSGKEYDDVIAAIKPFEKYFDSIKYSLPMLISDEDYTELITVITEETKQYADDNTAVVFMGHGTEHEANATYAKLNQLLQARNFSNYLIGTVEAEPTLEDVIAETQKLAVKRVVLLPLMIVAGDHANNDMAGDEEDSWKTIFESYGYEVVPVLRGLGQYPGVRDIFVRHVQNAISG